MRAPSLQINEDQRERGQDSNKKTQERKVKGTQKEQQEQDNGEDKLSDVSNA